ncbi:MAG: cytochrome c peroxidase [Bacteroidota bacterium]
MKRTSLIIFILITSLSAFTTIEERIFNVPPGWPKPKYDFTKNPLMPGKIALGRALFYDPILSRDSTISCNSCHSQFTAFAHVDHTLSHGIKNIIGTRNAPALMNLAWQPLFMWDGAINHLDMQPLAPISNHDEMNSSIDSVVIKLQRSKIYTSLFYNAYGGHIVTGENTLKAISQFMLTLVSDQSRYDSMIRKQVIFTSQENNGYQLFKQNCAACHTEPLFTNFKFENNGLTIDTTLNDSGRIKITNNENDLLKFKVPTLRNIEFSYPYMHDGRFKRLTDVLNHYTDGIEHNETLSNELQKPIVLSSNEKVDLVAFLLTLTDRNYFFDSRYSYPKEVFFKNQ